MSVRVLVTRPLPKGKDLSELLVKAGFDAVLWPCIDIHAVEKASILHAFTKIAPNDVVIFVSPNAVEFAWEALDEPLRQKLIGMRLFAVGKGTANALLKRGCQSVIFPALANSEALLALPECKAIKTQKVWICRGNKGRELIADTLSSQGAKVTYIQCYRTEIPKSNSLDLIQAWKQHPFDWVILTSQEALDNLLKMLGPQQNLLRQSQVTVMSERMATFAKAYGISNTHLLPAGDNKAIVAWLQNQVNRL